MYCDQCLAKMEESIVRSEPLDSEQAAAAARDHQDFYLNYTAEPGFPAAPKRSPGASRTIDSA